MSPSHKTRYTHIDLVRTSQSHVMVLLGRAVGVCSASKICAPTGRPVVWRASTDLVASIGQVARIGDALSEAGDCTRLGHVDL